MTANDDDNSRCVLYWQETEGKGVSLMIECDFFKARKTSMCKLESHVADYGENTSALDLSFSAELLPHWEKIATGFFAVDTFIRNSIYNPICNSICDPFSGKGVMKW